MTRCEGKPSEQEKALKLRTRGPVGNVSIGLSGVRFENDNPNFVVLG
jgi:hypothetical protein